MQFLYLSKDMKEIRRSKERAKLNYIQKKILLDYFNKDPKPNFNKRLEIAEKIGILEDKVKNWFQNQRAKIKIDQETIYFSDETSKNIFKKFVPETHPYCNNLYMRKDSNIK